MVKIPAGVESYQIAFSEIQKKIERMNIGYKMLLAAYQQNSIAKSFQIIQEYQALSFEVLRNVEEMMLIHQFMISGKKMYIRRTGQVLQFHEFSKDEDIEVDASFLLLFQHIHQVFGEVPWDMLKMDNEE
jgi:hypothetical protein